MFDFTPTFMLFLPRNLTFDDALSSKRFQSFIILFRTYIYIFPGVMWKGKGLNGLYSVARFWSSTDEPLGTCGAGNNGCMLMSIHRRLREGKKSAVAFLDCASSILVVVLFILSKASEHLFKHVFYFFFFTVIIIFIS